MNTITQNLNQQRNYGIDLLRLFSMYLVVVLHVLGHGGVLSVATGTQYAISWLIEIIAYCAVNCFAMISGYVGYTEEERPYHFHKYITLWLQVVFYTFGITLLTFVFKPDVVGGKDLIKAFLPVTLDQYWYFTAYTVLFFVIPWLNILIRRSSEKELNGLMLILFVIFSCYGTFNGYVSTSFHLMGGYSFPWLVLLYLCGAWMKKCEVPKKIKTGYALAMIIVCVLLTWVVKLFMPIANDILISYTSPTIVLIAVLYIVVFSKLKLRKSMHKFVHFLAPAAFGVYLIHEQKIIRNELMNSRFVWVAEISPMLLPILILSCAAGVFATCLLIEKIRMWLFKALRINKLINLLDIYETKVRMLLFEKIAHKENEKGGYDIK